MLVGRLGYFGVDVGYVMMVGSLCDKCRVRRILVVLVLGVVFVVFVIELVLDVVVEVLVFGVWCNL